MSKRGKISALRLLWLMGALVLIRILSHYHQMIQRQTLENFQPSHLAWATVSINWFLGAYLAVLFISTWSFRPNGSLLLCVCLPCTAITAYYPVVFTYTSNNVHLWMPYWLLQLASSEFLAIAAGFTLIRGLFTGPRLRKENAAV